MGSLFGFLGLDEGVRVVLGCRDIWVVGYRIVSSRVRFDYGF